MINKIEAVPPESLRKIHDTSLRILNEIGVVVPHAEMLDRLAAHGARVDSEKQHVRLPAELIAKAIADAGKAYTLHGRDLANRARFGAGARNYNSIAGEALWLDAVGGERRYATLGDIRAAARVADALDCINICGAMADPHEIPAAWRCVAVAAEMLKNTAKPIAFWFHDRASARYIVELILAARGTVEEAIRHPLTYAFLEPISPLHFPFDGIDLLFETARVGMPVSIGPMAQMGMSAPCSIAGTMAQENAEILAGIVMAQLIRPGTPICYGGICHAFDMATTQMIFAGPEQAIFSVLATQMGKFYGLPVYINAGLTDSKTPDAQAGLEIASTLAYGIAAGADIFGHMGICGVDQAASLDMLVLQNEIISYLESANRPIEASPETLAFETIRDVGPKGSFIDHMHTYENFRGALWFPRLLDRNYYDRWKRGGATDLASRIVQRKRELLASSNPAPLPPDLDREFGRIVDSAQKHLSAPTRIRLRQSPNG
ncbi:MAG: Trimethylamine methyltransferase (MTTB) [candidate division BRC1 bacterium ADurb.BinA364]|nr:MAG: Trimethylamine methyltransferase (MTTB) [candidate division BRC1 bacterium ADurb.BinA364]